MAKFDSKEVLLTKISEIYTEMMNGTIDVQTLDELVSLSEELHQRNIILRYKAFESKVLGVSNEPIQDVVSEKEEREEISENSNTIPVEEPTIEAAPSISFSLFEDPIIEEKPEEPILPLFDLSSEPIEEPISIIAENEVEAEIENNIETTEESFIEVDTIFNEETQVIEEPIIHSEEIVTEYEDQSVEIERSTVVEDPQTHEIIQESHSYEEVSIDEKAIASFMHKFKEIEQQIASQFGISKLETLVGSFGLNERLQYINELFDGSSEAFSEAVKILDNQHSSQNAFLKVAEIGTQNNWDIQSETVEEFMQKIKRRY